MESFGPYSLIRHIATGGMGELHLAERPGIAGFSKRLVVKRIRAVLADDPSFTRSFLDEGRVAALIDHSNIVQVYDMGEVDGILYLAMEHVAGKDLGSLIERAAPLDLGTALHVLCYLCEGLHYAHNVVGLDGQPLGLVHRDINPTNVLISFNGAVKLADFGIAKVVMENREQTQTGVIKGKFGYMAPEQAGGTGIDHRCDIYSLGLLLFEMTTGEQAVEGETDQAKLFAALDGRIRRPRDLDPAYPEDLERIYELATAMKPEDRFSSVEELHKRLLEFQMHQRLTCSAGLLGQLMKRVFPDAWQQHQSESGGGGGGLQPLPSIIPDLADPIDEEEPTALHTAGASGFPRTDERDLLESALLEIEDDGPTNPSLPLLTELPDDGPTTAGEAPRPSAATLPLPQLFDDGATILDQPAHLAAPQTAAPVPPVPPTIPDLLKPPASSGSRYDDLAPEDELEDELGLEDDPEHDDSTIQKAFGGGQMRSLLEIEATDPRDDASEPMLKPRVAPDALRRLAQELELLKEAPPQQHGRGGGRGIWIGLIILLVLGGGGAAAFLLLDPIAWFSRLAGATGVTDSDATVAVAPVPDGPAPTTAPNPTPAPNPTTTPLDAAGVAVERARDASPAATKTDTSAMGELRLTVTPSVDVTWKGRKLGRTPLKVPMPMGGHRILLKQPRLNIALPRGLRIRAGQATVINWTLRKGSLAITEPPSTQVQINGVMRGTTPLKLELYEGIYRVNLPDVWPRTRRFVVRPGQTTTVGPP
jgi:serine/threonine protein kinase